MKITHILITLFLVSACGGRSVSNDPPEGSLYIGYPDEDCEGGAGGALPSFECSEAQLEQLGMGGEPGHCTEETEGLCYECAANFGCRYQCYPERQ